MARQRTTSPSAASIRIVRPTGAACPRSSCGTTRARCQRARANMTATRASFAPSSRAHGVASVSTASGRIRINPAPDPISTMTASKAGRENLRNRSARAAGGKTTVAAASGKSDPTQNSKAAPCRKVSGRAAHDGADRAWPDTVKERAASAHAENAASRHRVSSAPSASAAARIAKAKVRAMGEANACTQTSP